MTGRSTATSTGGQRYLLYVPTGLNDPRVSYSTAAYGQAVDDFIERSGLAKYRGTVAPRNAFNSKLVHQARPARLAGNPDVRLGHSRITLFADVENFTNLINKNWGQIREYVFPYNVAVAQVQCLTTPLATGTTPTAAQIAATVAQACNQYRYSPLGGTTAFTDPVDQVYVNQSLYAIRVGAKFKF